MLRSLLDSVWPGRADADGEDERGDFVRSVLDASVLTGHGGGNPDAQRELADVQRTAATLEEQEQHRD